MKYVCSICGYVYDEAESGPWPGVPDSWKCPLCGAAKSDFVPEGTARPAADASAAPAGETEMKPLSALETAALCSNLARGCEKQYLAEQAEDFRKLADWFAGRETKAEDPSFGRLLALVDADLAENYPAAWAVSRDNGDRGALRSLTWSEKVTRILRSLLSRYADEGEAMLENTGVYVCTICGFVYVGSEPPEICPVCKVPNRKFERIGG